MKKISHIIYIMVVLLIVYYLYQHPEYTIQILAIPFSFLIGNILVYYLYQRGKRAPMSLMKFMGVNILKDILWAVAWMFVIKDNQILAIFIALVFLLLSIPLYIMVIGGLGKNGNHDKNQP